MIQGLFLFSLVLMVTTGDLPPGPKPFCDVKEIPKQLPLTVDQILSVDLLSYFVGYNLDFQQKDAKSFAHIKPTFYEQESVTRIGGQVISAKVSRNGNSFGNVYSLITQTEATTNLYFGHLAYPNSVPKLELPILIENDPKVNCFDVQVFQDLGIAILDCVNRTAKGPINLFYYASLTNHTVTSKVLNQRYVNFSSATKRKLTAFTDLENGYRYLVRAYFRQEFDRPNQDNTYIEIINANEMDDLQLIFVLDRSYLGLQKLSLTDVHYYQGQIILLDYYTGIYRYSVKNNQSPAFVSHYSCRRFLKMAVYSDNLEEEFLVAVANKNAIHQIDWQDLSNPFVVTKYSLISNTNITSLQLSLDYVVLTGSSEALVNDTLRVFNYTWVFGKQSRSYTNAYKVLSFSDNETSVSFDSASQYLLVTNKSHITNYALGKPTLILNQFNSAALNTTQSLTISVRSSDFLDNNTDVCDVNITVHFVERTNVSLWATDIATTQVFYSNYPGTLTIPLRRYAFGPNITYTYIKPFSEKVEAQHWVLKQNRTTVHMDKQMTHHVNFLRTDVVVQYGSNTIITYYQDTTNKTYLTLCRSELYSSDIYCNSLTDFQHSSKIMTMGTGFIDGTFGEIYINAFNLEGSPNIVYIHEFGRQQHLAKIVYPEGFQGKVMDIDLENGILYVTLPYLKRIDGYQLKDCDGTCPKIFQLTASTMGALGVQYFAPRYIDFTRSHPQVLFISSIDSVIVVDVDNYNRLHLLTEIVSAATLTNEFQIAVNKQYLLIVSAPSTIQQYRFQDLYRGKIVKHKDLELYNYRLPVSFDMEFNDLGSLFYITAIDVSAFSNCVLVFESGRPLVSSLYDIVFLPGLSTTRVEIEVSGSQTVDFLTIIRENNLTIIKEYETPVMLIRDADESFGFYIHLQNSQESTNITLAKVVVANYPDNFNKSTRYPSNFRKSLVRTEDNITWNDHNWFEGNVIGYDYKCIDCPDKIQLIGHIETIRSRNISAHDYYDSDQGGYILWNDVLKLNSNGTVKTIGNIPKSQNDVRDVCQRLVSDEDLMVITACTNPLSTVTVYVTSFVSYKPFTLGPWRTNSQYLTDLQIVNGLLMLVDVNPNPFIRYRTGGVYFYALDLDSIDDQSRIQEIDYIDTNDLVGAATWDSAKEVYVGNAFLSFNKHYRLYVSELTEGLFVTTFDWTHGDYQLNIKVVDYINMPLLMAKAHLRMPSDATFQAMTVLSTEETQTMQIQKVLLTTNNFHHFQIKIVYQKSDGRIGYVELYKVYFRYGYYNTYNLVRSYNGFVVIPYVIPPDQDKFSNYSKQHIAIYDSKEYSDDKVTPDGYIKRYIFTARSLETRSPTFFNFNRTQTSNETAGLVIVNPSNKSIFETKINRNVTILIKEDTFFTQNLFIWPYSDFHRFMFEFKLFGLEDRSLKGWQILLIVIGSLVLAVILAFIGWWAYKRLKRRLKQTILVEQAPEEGEDEVTPNKETRINHSLEIRDDVDLISQERNLEIEVKEHQEIVNPHQQAQKRLDQDNEPVRPYQFAKERQEGPQSQLNQRLL